MTPRPIVATLTNSIFEELWHRYYSTTARALSKATGYMIDHCAPGCVVTLTDKDGNWLGAAKLRVGGKIEIEWKEDAD